jgi:hypothetical protein
MKVVEGTAGILEKPILKSVGQKWCDNLHR